MENRSEEGKKAQAEYINDYQKKNYKIFSCRLKKEDWEDINSLIASKGLSKPDFIKYAAEKLKEGKI